MTEESRSRIPAGLRVLVTAGAAGIGRAIAARFAREGAQVTVCDIDEAALENFRQAHPDCCAWPCDVADERQVAALFESLDGLDVLVNNAGIAGPTAGVGEIDPAEWRRTLDVNLTGHFTCTHYAMPLLRASQAASIICLSSVAGRLGFPYRTPYAATKWGVVGFVKSLAVELGPEGIRVNAILPGVVEGPRIERVFAARAETLGRPVEEVKQENLAKVSLRSMVSAEDIADMAFFLCTPAGRNISGQALSVCGNVESL